MKDNYKYASAWSPYVYADNGAVFASDEDIRELLSEADLTQNTCGAAGVPIFAENDRVYVNDLDENWLIAGETGSKKTRSCIKPLIHSCIKKGSSMIIPDVKGGLIADRAIYEELRAHGYRVVRLDYRNFNGDGYNVLEFPTELYVSGSKDQACHLVKTFVSSLFDKYEKTTADPYWQDMAKAHMTGIIELLMRIAEKNSSYKRIVNLASVNSFCNEGATEKLKSTLSKYYERIHIPAIDKLKCVCSAPEKTRACIVSTTASALALFSDFDGLMRMHSNSTFNIREIYEKPLAIFIVLPDETKAFSTLAASTIDSLYAQIIDVYNKEYLEQTPPRRVEFICDEFCNLHINDMYSKISASRSRNIRWFITIQSLNQLKSVYAKEWDTIIANCKNILYLQSSDPELRKYVSDIAGNSSISGVSGGEPLIGVDKLKTLKKTNEYKEALYIRDDVVYKATLPDIDTYAVVKPYKGMPCVTFKNTILPAVRIYSIEELLDDYSDNRICLPFREAA